LIEQKLGIVFDIFNRGTELRRVEFGGVTQGSGLTVSGSTESVFAYVDFNDRLVDLAEREKFELVEQTSLARDGEGVYSFSFDVLFGDLTKEVASAQR
jgi:hypothetical protein